MARPFCVPLALVIALAGCMGPSGCSGQQDFSGQGAVCNERDSFHYGVQGGPVSKTETFSWQNSKGQARVALGFQGTGTAKVTLQDAAGATVFAKTFQGPGQGGASESTQSGRPGAWTIQIQMTNVQGQLGVTINAN